MTRPIWVPDESDLTSARITAFARDVAARHDVIVDRYAALHAWSIESLEEFWAQIWDFFDVLADGDHGQVLAGDAMPGARWFPQVRLNYAEHALRGAGDGLAVIAVDEDGATTTRTWEELRAEVGAFADWLRRSDVAPGDHVVGYLPNGIHALVAFLACASIGAVWSVCGQDYAAPGAAARFAQLEPVVLVAADGYRWNGRVHERRDQVAALRKALPSLRHTVTVSLLGLAPVPGAAVTDWSEATARPADLRFERVEFAAPLWVLFSSGTTGVPKGIVHGHGGVLLDHLKLLGLHLDLRAGDRFLWYTTTNWMMWNMQVSGLLLGATIVLYDGGATYPDPGRLWALAAEHHVAVLGVSPGYLRAAAKAGLHPGHRLDLSALRELGSTGEPLPAAAYHWVRDHIGPVVQVASTTGGTDVVSGFAGSAPTTPVWPGEISAPLLGVALEAWNADGEPVTDEVGELVITRPMPSMPIHFVNDPGGERYHDTYFSTYPGVWRHGDWVTRTGRGTIVVSGRSDSTLNRHGVRLGSADIYAVVEALPEVREAMVVGAELDGGDYWMPLFVVLEPGVDLDNALRDRITTAIRTQASPRHVPDEILTVPAIPHTRTGKKLEVPVKRLLQGMPIDRVTGREAVDDPDLLASFSRYAPSTRPVGSP
ncbi:acetoacetate--CoA ligase [Amycolatopsis pithecellobii]|uniref:Acetoacetate--CoA ligase n=1 Tax=Amycolatopsis pithecellobii TaxID=664692 RepID=A0A6N7YHP2_9PSEU|nr:acetoacetate--CoA ligase [Amycolatopsis pithecellobii]MTD52405.1 acetoacetate--CoA ligase [Amycolatopsis pithecellobii]